MTSADRVPLDEQILNTSGDTSFNDIVDQDVARLDDQPLSDAYGLLMHTNGMWEWTLAPGISPSQRYQHAAVFVGARLHVTGGVLRGGRAIEGEGAIASDFILFRFPQLSYIYVYFLDATMSHFLKFWTRLLEFGWIDMAL
ncbi:hypothetical protein GUJ93_ZPchr0009g1977 [Zizania palustris]|uniref:Uncharacterized protein n=1 Tax=Zizania palustris TaxID=103762 RepID=A0A8J5RPC5_ZIZPA|nr:hypothetical protein GUJ93_ZPchr0009g1977 [Zizania palustris]